MKYDIDIILRYHEGALDANEQAMLEAKAAADPAFARELAATGSIRSDLRKERTESFKPFFAERMLRRLRPHEAPEVALYNSLRWAFVRGVAVVGIAAVVLAGLNASTYSELDIAATFVDAVFGMPDASPIEAWTYDPSFPD
jgi:anti-sigma factor RsiW